MTNPNDEEFARAAFSGLDPVEPSANLRRNVAQIPITHERTAFAFPLKSLWANLLALGAAGALGILSGVLSLPDSAVGGDVVASTSTSAEPVRLEQALEQPAQSDMEADTDPLEGMLALALSTEWEGEDGDAWIEWDDDFPSSEETLQ